MKTNEIAVMRETLHGNGQVQGYRFEHENKTFFNLPAELCHKWDPLGLLPNFVITRKRWLPGMPIEDANLEWEPVKADWQPKRPKVKEYETLTLNGFDYQIEKGATFEMEFAAQLEIRNLLVAILTQLQHIETAIHDHRE